jgi:hypothetical protein
VIVSDQSPATAARISSAPYWNCGSSLQARLGFRKKTAIGTNHHKLRMASMFQRRGAARK